MAQGWRSKSWLRLVGAVTIGGAIAAIAATGNPTLAQIKPDTTLGPERSVVKSNIIKGLPSDQIDGGARRGANLFHSFAEFNVNQGRGAYFTNPAGIENILSRVTGGDRSDILGTLGVLGNANLFLINPQGIIFGPDARLDLGGSFVASTANSIKFVDGVAFNAKTSQTTPLLTVNVPIGLQFGGNPSNIQMRGDGQGLRVTADLIDTTAGLRVSSDQTLALVGGDLDLEGATLKTAGGRIELGSAAGEGLVNLTPTKKGFALSYQGVQSLGNIQLTQQSAVDASGAGGGEIQIAGRRVTITSGSQIEASTLGAEAGGALVVNANELLEVIGASADSGFPSFLGALVYRGATGNAGDININTGELLLRDGGQVTASTFGRGKGGNVTVTANKIQVAGESGSGLTAGSGLGATAEPGSTGDAGSLTINTGELVVRDGAVVAVSTRGTGKAGDLTITADSVQVIGISADGQFPAAIGASSNVGATGDAGSLTINTKELLIQDGAQVPTVTFTTGKGGDLTVTADTVQLVGSTSDGRASSGLFTSANQGSTGNGGSLTINTGLLLLQDGARVSTSTSGAGKGGNLTVTADSVQLIGRTVDGQSPSRLDALTQSSGNAGDIRINTQQLLVRDGAGVFVESSGTGDAGDLTIDAGSIRLDNKAALNSDTIAGQGNVFLDSQNLILRRGSNITTNAQGRATGGNIAIDTGVLAALENSDISANAEAAQGGQVSIEAQGIFGIEFRDQPTLASDITASSELGPQFGGIVEINTPDVDPSEGVVALPDVPVNVEVVQGCQAGSSNQASVEFFNTGKGGLAPSPYEPLSSSGIWEDVPRVTETPSNQTRAAASPATSPEKIVEAQGWLINERGEATLVAEVPTTHQSRCRLR